MDTTHTFTADQDQYLRRASGRITTAEMAEALSLPEEAVILRSRQLRRDTFLRYGLREMRRKIMRQYTPATPAL